MPHVSGGSSVGSSSSERLRSAEDPNDCDEVKVFKCAEDEGEDNKDDFINDDKRELIRATECEQGRKSPSYSSGGSGHSSYSSKNGHAFRTDPSSIFAKSLEGVPHPSAINMGYLMPYPYSNGSPLGSMNLKNIGLGAGSLPFFVNGVDGLSQPPPAHMGIPPYHHLDPTKAVHGLSRSPMYPFGGQYPYSVLPEVSQVASWHASNMYHSISNAGNAAASAGFRNYPPTLSIPPTSIPSDFYRFPPGSLLQGPSLGHGSLGHHLSSSSSKHDDHSHSSQSHRSSSSLPDTKSSTDSHGTKNSDVGQSISSQNEKKKPHIKKPLNAFMLYMKEMRAKVVAECTLKESAAINQILGRRWHSLSREEQAKYYEKARQERQLHLQLYPGWSARDNYGYGAKKKKRKKEKTSDGGREEQAKYYELARRERQRHMQMYPNWSSAQTRTHHEKKRKKKQEKFDGGNSMKKCRARYGLDQQAQWCKPCRRKKKCIRYLEGENGESGGGGSNGRHSSPDDNLGSAGSAGEPCTPDSKNEMDSDMDCKSSDMGMSSPNFSLTSPGMSLASPCMSLPSPALIQSPSSLASPPMSLPSLTSPLTPSSLDALHQLHSSSSHNNNNNNSSSSSSHNNNNHNHHHNHHNHHHNNNNSSQSSSNLNNSLFSSSPLSNTPSSSSSSSPPISSLILPFTKHSKSNPFASFFSPNASSSFPSLANLGLGFSKLGPVRSPVGANPHDVNNPLSVNQLTNNSGGGGGGGGGMSGSSKGSSSSSSSSTYSSKSTKKETPPVIGVS